MPEIAIEADAVTKIFRLYSRGGDRFREVLMLGQKQLHQQVRALHDVSFGVQRGEALGIIGDNGSGKSTLLRVLGKILTPTTGQVAVHFPTSVLIELAAGYDIQAPGRDNIIFQCRLLGMSSAEIAERMGEIIAFAELGPAIDMPMKTYSTGMRLRLAFSVALGLRREIMLIDEVLAVGDEYFQSKCFRRIKEIKSSNTTFVYVSHALGTVRSVCDRTIWLRDGEVAAVGESWTVIDKYLDYVRGRMGIMTMPAAPLPVGAPDDAVDDEEDSPAPAGIMASLADLAPAPGGSAAAEDAAADDERPLPVVAPVAPAAMDDADDEDDEPIVPVDEEPPEAPTEAGALPTSRHLTDHAMLPWARQGSHEVEVFQVELLDGDGKTRKKFVAGEALTIRLRYMAHQRVKRPNFGVAIYRNDGLLVYGTSSQKDGVVIEAVEGQGVVEFTASELVLLSGSYEVTVAIFDEEDIYKYDYHTRLYPFRVVNTSHDEGVARVRHSWEQREGE